MIDFGRYLDGGLECFEDEALPMLLVVRRRLLLFPA